MAREGAWGRIAWVVGLLLLGSVWLAAQSTGGRILGRVTDPTGAVLPGVSIQLVNEQTAASRSTQTNQTGDYIFPEVPVGTYRLEFSAQGFQTAIKKGVSVDVNQGVTFNLAMQVGTRTEQVEVTTEAPLVETNSTQLGAVVNQRAVENLPLNQRDTYQLLQLQPGVQSTVGSQLFYGSDQSGSVSVNGGRGRSNNFSVNGGDSNDLFVNGAGVQPSPDSVQEFRVISNTFDAEYGRNSGAVINVVTKSGTNKWHGSAYEYFRNKVLNAKNFFDTTTPDFKQNQFGATIGGPIIKDRTFIFGAYEGRRIIQGITGQPVLTPQTDAAGNYSPTLDPTLAVGTQFAADVLNNRPGCSAALVAQGGAAPTLGASWASVFGTTTPGSFLIPAACMDPAALNLFQQFVPAPNSAFGFVASPSSRAFGDQFQVRLDHRINDRQNLSVYYYFDDTRGFQPYAFFQAAGANLPGFGSFSNTRTQQWNVTHTFTLSPTVVNELRLNYYRESDGVFQHPQTTNLVTNSCTGAAVPFCFTGTTNEPALIPPNPRLGITPNLGAGAEGVPFISVSGSFAIGNNFEGQLPQTGNTYQIADNLTKVSGNHTMKFGVDFRNQRFDQTLFFNVNGEYLYFGGGPNDTGDLNANYFLGFPDSYSQGSAQTEDVRTNSFYLFAQDSWRIRSNLTLNYGLRWELNTPLADAGHRVQTFRAGQATTRYPCQLSPASVAFFQGLGVVSPDCNNTGVFPTGLVVPGDAGIPSGLTQTYYRAFAPRIGVAWSPDWGKNWLTGGPGKTSVRAGFGIFYNPIEQLVLEQFSAEPPFGGSNSIPSSLFSTPFVDQSGGIHPNVFNGILNPPPGTAVDWSLFRPIILFGQFQPNMRAQYTAQYNFTIQRELSNSVMLQIGYVGSQGHRLLATHDINFANSQSCLDLIALSNANPAGLLTAPGGAQTTCGPFLEDSSYFITPGTVIPAQGLTLPYGPTSFIPGGTVVGPNGITLVGLRPFSSPQCNPMTGASCPQDGVPVFSSIFAQDTIAGSGYNSMQVMLEKRFSRGLQFQAAYTWSKSIDNASSFENILNPLCARCNNSLSLFDARNRFVFNYYWELPIPKYSGAWGKVVNGWASAGIVTLQSGFPIRITSSDDLELMNSFDFELPGEPNQVANFSHVNPRNNGVCALGTGGTTGVPCQTGTYWFDPNNIFQPQALGTIGNAPRTICCGPGIANVDFSIIKNTPIGESKDIQFMAQFFNLFNHTQFFNPDGNITDGPTFGLVQRARDPRLIQFALKFSF